MKDVNTEGESCSSSNPVSVLRGGDDHISAYLESAQASWPLPGVTVIGVLATIGGVPRGDAPHHPRVRALTATAGPDVPAESPVDAAVVVACVMLAN
ncbi:hypothetical protein J6590_032730 [Homalodisca vitripennis]|nr:hypothetical protein J6590_032730 [Homalodisca vitripennis]